MQSKKPFEIILHVGRVTSLRSWMVKKSCHSQTLMNGCSISDYPPNFENLNKSEHKKTNLTVSCDELVIDLSRITQI